MIYILTLILLTGLLYFYFPFARKHHMLAGVNHRSSHTKPVITGAGFIFYVSYLVYAGYIVYLGEPFPWLFFIGLTALAIISFIDDFNEVWFLPRLFIQFFAAALLLWQLYIDKEELGQIPSMVQWMALLVCWVFVVGLINLHNFMDGLNGMLGFLVLSSLIPMWLINEYVLPFIDVKLFYFTLIPTLLFVFLNARKQAICFSGDVGAVVLGFVASYALLALLIESGNLAYLAIFTTFFIEAGLTIVQRLFAGENIFKPHRIHLFQLLCNENKKSHVAISGIYAAIQLGFGLALFVMNYYGLDPLWQNVIVWPIVAVLALSYLLYKRKLMGGHLLDYKKETVGATPSKPKKVKDLRRKKKMASSVQQQEEVTQPTE